jgi:SRSO17 transposase
MNTTSHQLLTRRDYCQFLLSSQKNFTLTYFADHSVKYSHDQLNRYLSLDKITPADIWAEAKHHVIPTKQGYLLFDDTVIDKNYSSKIEMVRRQYSGNAGKVIKGIGVVTCVYVNPQTAQYWIIDYRFYDKDRDDKTKLHHVKEMFLDCIENKKLPFTTVLMDSWYAVKWLMLLIESEHKIYYCPIKGNRNVNEISNIEINYQRVDSLSWTDEQKRQGRRVHLRQFPKGHSLQLYCLPFSTERTDYIVTNAPQAHTVDDIEKICAVRWRIEQCHRELKQTTGLERCQCRKAQIQRNHIACCLLVWHRLKALAIQFKSNIYQLKQGLLDSYMRKQLKKPELLMTFSS